jgi:hypothetical protein
MASVRRRPAEKRRTSASKESAASAARVDLAAARFFAAAYLPLAQVNAKFGNASFSVAGKVFAFTRPDGLVLKLPPEIVAATLATREAQPLVMGKRTMREWVHLKLPMPESYRDELYLLRAAMAFVQSAPQS